MIRLAKKEGKPSQLILRVGVNCGDRIITRGYCCCSVRGLDVDDDDDFIVNQLWKFHLMNF